MFDTLTGLPVHALVVHAVVVLIPLMSLVSFLVALVRKWRPALPWVVLANLLVVGATYAARQSGIILQQRLNSVSSERVAVVHGHRGILLIWFALALFIASVIAWALSRTSVVLRTIAVVLVALAGLAATGWTAVVGDTGARAVWEQRIANTSR